MMARISAAARIVAAAVGGYVVGRRRDELMDAVERFRAPPLPVRPPRGWDDETEYEHESEREVAERHRVADEIKRHPLRERTRVPKVDERQPATGRRRRSDEDLGYPRPY